MKAWITHYALSTGIFTADGEIFGTGGAGFRVIDADGCTCGHFFGNSWHKTEEKARARFNEMKENKLKSLEKRRAKIDKLTFKVKS